MEGKIRVYFRKVLDAPAGDYRKVIDIPYSEEMQQLLDEGYMILSMHPMTDVPLRSEIELEIEERVEKMNEKEEDDA